MSQVQRLREALASGPKTREQLAKLGVSEYELRARITDLRRLLQRRGGDVLHRPQEQTWELVAPLF